MWIFVFSRMSIGLGRRRHESGPLIVGGVDYLLIRSEILDAASNDASCAGGGGRLLVTLGGAALASSVMSVVDAAVQVGWHGGIDAVIPPGDSVDRLPTRRNMELFESGSVLLTLAKSASIVISAAGVTSWEMLALGKQLGILKTASNQAQNYDYQTVHGLSWGLGDLRNTISLDLFSRFFTDTVMRERMPIKAAGAIDGLGAQRGADLIMSRAVKR